jgi:hypothetical protein
MSEAIHCDASECENWATKGTPNNFITLQKNYKYKHFCTFLCMSEAISTLDLIDGFDD